MKLFIDTEIVQLNILIAKTIFLNSKRLVFEAVLYRKITYAIPLPSQVTE